MNDQLTFSGKRVACPCGESSKGFSPLAGRETEPFGKCFVCGKFFPPSGKEKRSRSVGRPPARQPDKPPIPQQYADDTEVMNTLSRLLTPGADSVEQAIEAIRQRSPFHGYLIDRTGKPGIFLTWSVGFDTAGNVLYWYEDAQGRFLNCKAVRYKPDAHRDKNVMPRFLYNSSQGFSQCLYGLFQLHPAYCPALRYTDSSTPVVLVEAEKSAILCSVVKPEFLWLATGGANGLTRKKAEVLRGRRKVTVWYDADNGGRTGATQAVEVLRALNIRAAVYDPFPELDDGTDAADLLDKMPVGGKL